MGYVYYNVYVYLQVILCWDRRQSSRSVVTVLTRMTGTNLSWLSRWLPLPLSHSLHSLPPSLSPTPLPTSTFLSAEGPLRRVFGCVEVSKSMVWHSTEHSIHLQVAHEHLIIYFLLSYGCNLVHKYFKSSSTRGDQWAWLSSSLCDELCDRLHE